MSKQSKATESRMLQAIHMILILLLALLIPFTGYTADVNEDLIKAAEKGDTATVRSLLAQSANVNATDNRWQDRLD